MTKEEKENFEAMKRKTGMAMIPVEELTLIGFYESNVAALAGRNNEIFIMECGGELTALNEIWEKIEKEELTPKKDWNEFEEYDFDENDEQYKELAELLRLNNDRRKYFA